jgi:MFS family permease
VILVQSNVANPFQVTVIISCLTFLGTIVGPTLVDKAGRRPVALVGFTILFVLNMAAGGLAAAGLTTSSQRLGLAAVFIIFAFFNAASFQSLAFLLPTEVATPALREPTVSWAIFWSYSTAIMTSFAVPQIISPDAGNLGAKAAFIFGGCVFLTIIWAWFYVPETKARSVAEIDELYRSGVPMWRWKDCKCRCLAEAEEVRVGEKRETEIA